MTVTLACRADIDLAAFARVAWDGEAVAVAPAALADVARRREEFLALVASDPTRKLYGVNVHAGDGSDRVMTEAEQSDYSRGLHSATSFGEPFPRRVVRGFVLARLANLIEGHAGVTPELVTAVAARLDGRELPPVPRLGNGGPGEILALGWLFADVPEEMALGIKEGMALINGAPCAAALLADATLCTERALALAVDVFCLAVAALGVAPAIYHERLEELWGDPGQAAALRAIRSGIAGAQPPPGAGAHPQPPVSFRILPRVLGNANRLLAAAREATEIALPEVSDNPVFLFGSGDGDGDGDLGDIVSTGGFHNGAAPSAIDGLTFALAELAQLAHHQLQRLQTSPEAMPGLDSLALGTIQMVSAGYAEEARSGAVPSLLPLPGFGQNDAPSPAFHAWNRFDRVQGFVVGSLTCLAALAAQSFARTGRAFPPALRELGDQVLETCPPVVERRSVGAELGRLAHRLGSAIPR
ncbi:MAG TPA: aromatic amino acid lyase [Solirubrobacteraceae bacterium]